MAVFGKGGFMDKRDYKDLHVWRESISFITEVYQVVRGLPREENYAMSDQIKRAAVSVAANIAEGQARYYRLEFLKHLRIAKGSLAELHTLLIIAEQVGYISPITLEHLENSLFGVSRPLNGLIAKLSPGGREDTRLF
jgi:four helix bundle protein